MKQLIHVYMIPDVLEEQGFYIQCVPPEHVWILPDEAVKLEDHIIELADLKIPDLQELQVLAIQSLEAKQDAIMKKAAEDTQALQSKIDSLLLLEHK